YSNLFVGGRGPPPPAAAGPAPPRGGPGAAPPEAVMGTVEAGKLANFAVLDENPLADIRNLRTITLTVKRGHRYDRAEFEKEGE
ncbi:hypothetical protein ACFW2E_44905, partial [Streptomyces sp. NPDC058964]